MRPRLLYLAIGVVFVALVAYVAFWVTSQGFNLADSFWAGAAGNLLATVIGVAVAIPAGLLLDRLVQSSRQEEIERRLIHLLREELDEALEHDLLRDPLRPEIPPVYVETGAWEAALSAGDTASVSDLELLAQVTNAYHRINSLNEWLGRVYDASYGTGVAVNVSSGGDGESVSLPQHVSRVLLNLVSQHRPYIEMIALRLRRLDAG